MRRSKASQNREQKNILITIVLVIVVVAFIGIAAAWKFFGHSETPNEMLCSSLSGPKAHVVLLVDKTDPLSFTQSKAVHQILDDFTKGKYVPEGALLSVYVLGEDFKQTAEPLFEKCNPGDGSSRSKITENPELWKRKFQTDFVNPLFALEEQLKSPAPANRSPILEMLQVVGLRFNKFDVQGKRQLYVVSDMLHNSTDYSMYKSVYDFDSLKRQPQFARLRASLKSVDVGVFMLMNNPQFQTRILTKFWQDYFKDMGGSLEKIEPLPG